MTSANLHVLILSPHRDDAAFSCGLFAASMLRRGSSLTIANVCTTSDYAPYLADQESDRIGQVTAERAQEDERFYLALAAHAGVSRDLSQEIDLKWQDAPLRLAIPAEAVLTQEPEQSEVDALAAAFASLPAANMVLAPLALGGHLDHRLVREAAVLAFGGNLGFYEDLPYAARISPSERNAAIAPVSAHLQIWTPSSSEKAGTKRALAMHYPSQIASEVADEMDCYARKHGGVENLYLNQEVRKSLEDSEGWVR